MGDKEKGNKGFHEVVSRGGVDVTNDSVAMLNKFAEESGTGLEITTDKGGRRIAKIVAVAVTPEEKKKKA